MISYLVRGGAYKKAHYNTRESALTRSQRMTIGLRTLLNLHQPSELQVAVLQSRHLFLTTFIFYTVHEPEVMFQGVPLGRNP